MKKLLAILLILGMASMANAAMIVISVDGAIDVEEIGTVENPLVASTDVALDVSFVNPAGMAFFSAAEEGYYSLVCGPAGTISGGAYGTGGMGALVLIDPSIKTIPWGPATAPFPDVQGIHLNMFISTGTGVSDLVLYDGINFHCEGLGDVQIDLLKWSGDDFTISPTVIDSVYVHQVPEPMTMSLLSLGGLALLRRRR